MKTEALNCRCCGGVLDVKSALAVTPSMPLATTTR